MRIDLQKLYTALEGMARDSLIASFRGMIETYDGFLSLQGEKERALHEMSLQFGEMKSRLAGFEKENTRLKEENLRLTQQLGLRKKDLFGRTTEKISDVVAAVLSGEAHEDPVAEDTAECLISENTDGGLANASDILGLGKHRAHGKKTQGKRRQDLSGLPAKTEFLLDIDSLDQEYGGGNWRIYGWTRHEEYASIPSSKYLKVTYTPVLSIGLEHHMVRVPYTGKLLPGSLVSASLLAEILYNKFVLGLPAYRQEQDLRRNGIVLSRQTMVNWTIRFAMDLFGPVYDRLACLLRLSRYNQCDETVLEVVQDGRKAGAKSYMWVHTTSELSVGNPIAVFCYELTRGTQHLRDFYLENGYQGFITSDAYTSYGVLEKEAGGDISATGCFMHCRRRFVNAILVLKLKGMAPERVQELPEFRAQFLIDDIYRAETPLKGLSFEERLERRNTEVRPKVDAFFAYIHSLDTENPVSSERLKDAICYALNQEAKLRMFLDDAAIPCDNGHVERSIRTLAVGRSNWLFSYSITGAEVMAIIYTLTETAQMNHVHPYYYLMYLLEKMPVHMEDKGRSFLEDMMPWSPAYHNYENEKKQETIRFCSDQHPVEPPKTPRKKDRNGSETAA